MTSNRILIIGGSTRAAADSVRRAGWHPICADLFADSDLRMTADVIPVRNYPHSLPDDVAKVRADGWFYCGALENHPAILESLSKHDAPYGPLLGTSAAAVKRIRDPYWLAEALRVSGSNALEVASETSPPAPDGTWVQKPLASAGGRAIRIWDAAAKGHPLNEPHYFQRRADGQGMSALFHVDHGNIEWLGASEELATNNLSEPPSHFSYCGSCGPSSRMRLAISPKKMRGFRYGSISSGDEHLDNLRTSKNRSATACRVRGTAFYHTKIQRQLTRIAKMLVNRVTGIRGLIGLDFRLDGLEVWITEINPRYTASVEILELASHRSFLNPRVSSCQATSPIQNAVASPMAAGNTEASPRGLYVVPTRSLIVAKQIVYASRSMKILNLSQFASPADPWQVPSIADIPNPGTEIDAGWPICTVLASGTNVAEVEISLRTRVAEVRDALERAP